MSDFRRMQLERAGRKAKAQARAGRIPRSSPVSVEQSARVEEGPLDRVVFASTRAREIAEEKGLTWRHFSRSVHVASSDKGYTTSDVRAISREKE